MASTQNEQFVDISLYHLSKNLEMDIDTLAESEKSDEPGEKTNQKGRKQYYPRVLLKFQDKDKIDY